VVQAEVREVIGAQTEALGRGDFAGARAQASRAYQERVPLATFMAIISADYPYLLAQPQTDFGDCMVLADGVVLMAVTYDPGDALLYWLVREDDRLVIDGAGPLAVSSTPVPA